MCRPHISCTLPPPPTAQCLVSDLRMPSRGANQGLTRGSPVGDRRRHDAALIGITVTTAEKEADTIE